MGFLNRRWLFVALLAGTLACTAARLLVMQALDAQLQVPADGLVIEVQAGEGLSAVALRLGQQGVLPFAQRWRLYARVSGRGGRLLAGEYVLPPGTTGRKLLDMLASGRVLQRQVTLVEGWTTQQALQFLQAQPRVRKTLDAADPVSIARVLGKQFSHAEGLLFPDTYNYVAGTTDRELLLRAYQRLLMVLELEWQQRGSELPYESAYQALIMASIVEKETGVPAERPRIAGVFVERLARGMRLETDPTVIYGLGQDYRGNITRAHLKQATAYNTYVIRGLPPTPIALAGREAIRAALHPERDGSLYFVARGDGSHQFSRTYQEHLDAVRRYQLEKRAMDYRSAPSEGKK